MKDKPFVDRLSEKVVDWIGSGASLIVHTFLFGLNFSLCFFGVDFNTVLLILTTFVSIEAIYLAIFMQNSINQQGDILEDVEDDMEALEKAETQILNNLK
jgi:uncharacterized membrane protein